MRGEHVWTQISKGKYLIYEQVILQKEGTFINLSLYNVEWEFSFSRPYIPACLSRYATGTKGVYIVNPLCARIRTCVSNEYTTTSVHTFIRDSLHVALPSEDEKIERSFGRRRKRT